MKISIKEAAYVTGKTTRTIYRHIKSGRVSAGHDADNALVVDTSELIRAYGEIKQPVAPVSDNMSQDDTAECHDVSQGVTSQLIATLEALQRQIASLERVVTGQGELITVLTNRLEYMPAEAEPLPTKTPPPQTKPTPTPVKTKEKSSGKVLSFGDLAKKYI